MRNGFEKDKRFIYLKDTSDNSFFSLHKRIVFGSNFKVCTIISHLNFALMDFRSSLLCLFVYFISTTTYSQNYILDAQFSYGVGIGNIEYQGNEVGFINSIQAYNVHFGVSKKLSGPLYIRAQLGTADHELFANSSYGDYRSSTRYSAIQQFTFGLYPEVFIGNKNVYATIGLGPDLYLVRTTVSDNELEDWSGSGREINHPQLENRLGFQAHLNFYFRSNQLAFVIGFDFKQNQLFEETFYFPSFSLGMFNTKVGVAYFLFDDQSEDEDQ